MRMYESASITKQVMVALLMSAALVVGVAQRATATDASAGLPQGTDEARASVDEQVIASDIGFSSPIEAYRQGKAAFDMGWYGLALPALRYAAERGVFGAKLKLAKMYELGLGIPRDDAAAFRLYRQLTDKNRDLSNFHPAAPFIGQSLAALGTYNLNGIAAINLKPDASEAVALLTQAAEYFGDPRAQYELAKLYIAGDGVKKDTKRAVAWLYNAARKDYAPAQAMLGQILWDGEIVPQLRLKALVLLTLARNNAAPQDSEWIGGLYNTIMAGSQPDDLTRAKAAVARWVKIYQPSNGRAEIVVQKEVRIGIAEDRDIEGTVSVLGDNDAKLPVEAERNVRQQSDPDQRMWSGSSSFREIDR